MISLGRKNSILSQNRQFIGESIFKIFTIQEKANTQGVKLCSQGFFAAVALLLGHCEPKQKKYFAQNFCKSIESVSGATSGP
jgi:hypothetical protein